MPNEPHPPVDHSCVELDGTRYVILRETVFDLLCQKVGIRPASPSPVEGTSSSGFDLDQPALAERLARRRQASGLSQAELARRAGIRPETLNRIERGRVTPDFATIRKLVVAIGAAERTSAVLSNPTLTHKESENVVAEQPHLRNSTLPSAGS
jgi:DNA-binding XRE family transcriptional regulator